MQCQKFYLRKSPKENSLKKNNSRRISRMEENNAAQLKIRKEELETTLKNLAGLIESRNHVLTCFEKNVLRRVIRHKFSNLNAGSRGNMLNGATLIKKTCELDLKLFRRGQFYLQKRKRRLHEELVEVEEMLKKFEADSVNPLQSA